MAREDPRHDRRQAIRRCAHGAGRRLPVKATLGKTIGKEAVDTVHVFIEKRIG
jgi:hypothetical protein